MSVTSEATTVWEGPLTSGSGTTTLDCSQAATLGMTWAGRAEGVAGATNPEELLGAAHSACFSMALAHALTQRGTPPESLHVTAAVTFAPGEGITGSHLLVRASIPGISEDDFQEVAADAKANCPVSKALAGIPITLEATLG